MLGIFRNSLPDGSLTMKEYEWNPYELPEKLRAAIGLAIACYAQTESMMQEAIAGCAGLDFEYGGAVTTHMTMPLRLSVLRSVAEIRIDNLDDLDELDRLLSLMEDAATKRNALAHNKWCFDPESKDTFFLRESARGSFKVDLVPMGADQVESDARFIYETGMKLMAFLSDRGLLAGFPHEPRQRGHKSRAARKARRRKMGHG